MRANAETPALSGAFQPNGSLAAFDLESLNGDWLITVSDNRSGSYTGTLNSWCLEATGPTASAGGGASYAAAPQAPVENAPGGNPGVLAAFLPRRPFTGLLFTAAEWLAARVLRIGSSLKAAQNALRAVQESLLLTQSPGSGEVWRSYYYSGGQRVGMREQDGTAGRDAVYYLFGDHLGSTSVIADGSGNKVSEMRFLPWGELRYAWFDPGVLGGIPTDFTFTGQRDFSGIGLLDYGARFYDAALGRFVQADTLVPGVGNPASFDRYAYVLSNPLKYVDPSGNISCSFQHAAPGDCYDPPPPTPVNLDLLSDEPGGKTGISGRDFYNWYLELWDDKDGWWWEIFGQDKDGFTIWDAFAVIYVYETFKNWSNPHIAEAAIRDANAWCRSEYQRACTTEDYINHFAHEYQSAGNYVRDDAYVLHDPRIWFTSFSPGDAAALNRVAGSFSDHPNAWDVGCSPDRPCGWANNHPDMYDRSIRQHLHANQDALFVYAPPDDLAGNPWFIPSGCVVSWWLEGHLDVPCSPVR